MKRTVPILITLALAFAAAAPAGAQSASVGVVTIGPFGSQPTLQTTIPVHVSGQLTVRFHGDTAAGCERWGLCGYSGTVSWRPGASASLIVSRTLGSHAQTTVSYLPSFPAGLLPPGGVTNATVALRTGSAPSESSQCIDAVTTTEFLNLPVHAGRVMLSLAGGVPPLLATRCAGPRDGDVMPALPAPTLSVTALRRGHATISLVASRALNAHGFSGTVASTIRLRLGTPGRTTRSNGGSGPSRGRRTRVRVIDVRYRASISGSVTEQVRGESNPLLCAPLGACGLTGSVTLTPRAVGGHVTLSATELASKPARRLTAAVGLSSGPSGGIFGFGAVQWRGSGSMAADLVEGAERCHDTANLGAGEMLLATARGRLGVSYTPGALLGATGVTRCPGPLLTNAVAAAATVPLSTLARRTATIRLTTAPSASDDGYTVRFVPHLTLTLTRVSSRSRVLTLPAGATVGS